MVDRTLIPVQDRTIYTLQPDSRTFHVDPNRLTPYSGHLAFPIPLHADKTNQQGAPIRLPILLPPPVPENAASAHRLQPSFSSSNDTLTTQGIGSSSTGNGANVVGSNTVSLLRPVHPSSLLHVNGMEAPDTNATNSANASINITPNEAVGETNANSNHNDFHTVPYPIHTPGSTIVNLTGVTPPLEETVVTIQCHDLHLADAQEQRVENQQVEQHGQESHQTQKYTTANHTLPGQPPTLVTGDSATHVASQSLSHQHFLPVCIDSSTSNVMPVRPVTVNHHCRSLLPQSSQALTSALAVNTTNAMAHGTDKENQQQSLLSPIQVLYSKLENFMRSQVHQDSDASSARGSRHNSGQPQHELLESEDEQEDHSYYCVDCNQTFSSPCPSHEQFVAHIEDIPILPRAKASLPAQLLLRESRLQMKTEGVWTNTEIKKGTRFGPLVGTRVTAIPGEITADPPTYWKIVRPSKKPHYIECKNNEVCNWMMYLKRARTNVEQNLTAFQHGKHIYFVTCEDVPQDTELAFWYGREYCKTLGATLRPEGSFHCERCDKQFVGSHALNQHIRYTHADMKTRKFKCTICMRAFTSQLKLQTHHLVHSGVKPHKCDVCFKQFTDRSNLLTHLSIHTGEKKFKCQACDKSFRQKAHLASHMITHTGEKKLQCPYCGKKFGRSSDLRVHEYKHTKERLYRCQTCNKEFFKLQNYKKHMFVHTGLRPHECDKCSKTFTQKYHLTRHKQICKGPKPVKTEAGKGKKQKKGDVDTDENMDDLETIENNMDAIQQSMNDSSL